MGGRDLDVAKKAEILTLIRENRYTIREIAERCHVGKSTVQRIKHNQGRDSIRLGRCGRKRITVYDDRLLIRISKASPHLTVPQLQNELRTRGIQLSITSIRERLHEANGKSVKPRKVPLLTATMRRKRLQFAEAHAHWSAEDWRRVRNFFIIM